MNALKYVMTHIYDMANMTLSIPDDIRERMRKYPEIKWSEVVRRAILEYLDELAGSETRELSYYAELAKRTGVSIEDIPLDAAEKHYEKMRDLEWKRHSTTRTSS
jgi:histone H3/H4